MEKIHENVHVLCFHANFEHESTKTCSFPCTFSYFLPPSPLHYIIKVNGLLLLFFSEFVFSCTDSLERAEAGNICR